MGSSCCQKDSQAQNPQFQRTRIDEFNDPFIDLKSKQTKDPTIIQNNAPRNAIPLQQLPITLIKLQNSINQRFPPQKLPNLKNSHMLSPYQLSKDFYYYGQWLNGQQHGLGKLYFPDKSAYFGYFNNGKAEGYGRLFHPNGDAYIGQWKDNKAHGNGKYVSVNGAVYQGGWVEDQRSGRGTEEWNDGTVFQGLYDRNKKNGLGKFKWASGNFYVGNFKDNKKSGQGLMKYNDGSEYNGSWYDDQMHGYGEFKWPNGKYYKGMYEKDLKHGQGKMVYSNGKVYEGQWIKGKPMSKETQFQNSIKFNQQQNQQYDFQNNSQQGNLPNGSFGNNRMESGNWGTVMSANQRNDWQNGGRKNPSKNHIWQDAIVDDIQRRSGQPANFTNI